METTGTPKCHTMTCSSEATHRVYWPGQEAPKYFCVACTERARGIMGVLGLGLAVERSEAR